MEKAATILAWLWENSESFRTEIYNEVAKDAKKAAIAQAKEAASNPIAFAKKVRGWFPPGQPYTRNPLADNFFLMGPPRHSESRRERHDAIFLHPDGREGTSSVWPSWEAAKQGAPEYTSDDRTFHSVLDKDYKFYHKGPVHYDFARRKNLSSRAANRQAIIRLSKGRYHPY